MSNGIRIYGSEDSARIAFQDHEWSITYAQLPPLVEAERRWLETGGKRFALLAANGCSWAIADLALLEAKLLNVPLPPYFTAQQLRHVVADAGVDSILTDQPRLIHDLFPNLMRAGESPGTGLTPPLKVGPLQTR